MKRVLIGAGILAVVLLSGVWLYKHFVTDRIMDRGGMENPYDTEGSGDVQILDGDHTYVDNQALLDVIAGRWQSGDGRWTMTLGDDQGVILALNGTPVLESRLDFAYLQPGTVQSVEFTPDDSSLKNGDGSVWGEICSLSYAPGESSGTMCMEIACADGGSEAVELVKWEPDQREE